VFTDPAEGHLAAAALAPKGARLGDLVNPRAVTYIVPRTISSGAFSDAARSTHSTLFQDHSNMDPFHIISNMAYPCADGVHHRIEIVYHESLDPTILSTTPIMYDGTKYAPLSSTVSHIITRFVFTDYQFHSSLDFGVRLEQFCSWYFEDTMKMGKVIKIEIPLFPTPNGNYEARSQFTVYVKSDKTAEDCKIDRLLSLGSRQKAPCRISWMGASPFCNYCKGDGHLIPQCPKRLAIVCSACKANGHVSFTCSRFSARDAKGAKGKMPVRGQSTATSSAEPPSPSSSSITSSSSSSTSSTSTSSPSSPSLLEGSQQPEVALNTDQSAMTTTDVTSQSQVVDLTGNESPSNTSNDAITVSESQGQGRTDVDQDGDVSLKEADLEDFDREANNINNSPLTNSSDDNDEPMEDIANNSVAARTKANRTVVKPAAATTAKSTAKATNNMYTKGGRPKNKSTSTKNSWKK
jgi:hypothetical protein